MSFGSCPCCLSHKLLTTFRGKSVPQDNLFVPLGQAETAWWILGGSSINGKKHDLVSKKSDQCSESICLYTSSYQWRNSGKCNHSGDIFHPGSMDLAVLPSFVVLSKKWRAAWNLYLVLFVWRLSLEACSGLTDGARAEIHIVMLIY